MQLFERRELAPGAVVMCDPRVPSRAVDGVHSWALSACSRCRFSEPGGVGASLVLSGVATRRQQFVRPRDGVVWECLDVLYNDSATAVVVSRPAQSGLVHSSSRPALCSAGQSPGQERPGVEWLAAWNLSDLWVSVQSASVPISRVRMRTSSPIGVTQILPSPSRPVEATVQMTSITSWMSSSRAMISSLA
jgi:hypothetical protein